MKYDLKIINGHILDGTGNPWFNADLGILGNKINAIGRLKDIPAEKKIDATGMIVSPGFIDIHTHSDYAVLIDGRAESKIRQGVTTEVVGNCGSSSAPMNAEVKEYREKHLRSQVGEEFEFNWTTVGDYLNLIDSKGVSINVVSLVGQGTIRQNVMGYDNRPPTDSELHKIRSLVKEAMKDGAWGLSTGLSYAPGYYATTDEIVELTKGVVEYDGIYVSHVRSEGDALIESVKEAIEVGKRAGVPVHISHFKALKEENWGKTKESLKLVEDARNRGIDITFDQYPYIAASTGLAAFLPKWAHEGGAEKMLELLQNPETRRKIADSPMGPATPTHNWENVLIVTTKNFPEYEGKTIAKIAQMEGKEPLNTVFDLLLAEEGQVSVVAFGMCEEDVRRVMQSPYGMVGSDGSAISPHMILGRGKPHPRYYGTFPRIIGHYVREGVLNLQEAIRKMTSAPAQRLGLRDRGLLREGFKADITIFDPDEVKDNATFTDPHRYASGIPYVIVNGIIVVENLYMHVFF